MKKFRYEFELKVLDTDIGKVIRLLCRDKTGVERPKMLFTEYSDDINQCLKNINDHILNHIWRLTFLVNYDFSIDDKYFVELKEDGN